MGERETVGESGKRWGRAGKGRGKREKVGESGKKVEESGKR